MTGESTPGSIRLETCHECGATWQTHFPGCPYCGDEHVTTIHAGGHGQVYSWVEVHMPLHSDSPPTPYTVVTVELDTGAKVFAAYPAVTSPYVGQRVEVCENPRGAPAAAVTVRVCDETPPPA